MPLAAVAVDPKSELIPAQRAVSLPQPGSGWLPCGVLQRRRLSRSGNFHQKTSITCGVMPVDEVVSSLGLAEPMAGGGVFDIDGGLVALILPCNGRVVAIAAGAVDGLLARADTIEQRMLSDYGVALGPLSAEEADHFKTSDGLLVRDVWTGYAGDDAGHRPGDVLMAVNEREVRTVEDLRVITAPVELTLLRGSKRMKKALSASGVQAAAGAALVLEAPRPVYRIPSVRPDSAAARAGLEAGDRVIRINQVEPRNLDQINRVFRGDKRPPIWIEVERGARRVGMLVR